MRRWAARCCCVAGGLVVALLAGEGIVRVAGLGLSTVTRGSLHAFHPDAGWMCLPNCDAHFELPGVFDVRVVCNSRGLRGPERTLAKPPGTRRVLALGDSFMWGFGVENDEMFSSRLEDLLADTQVLNFGANGYSTVQELARLETDGLSYAPDVSILAFCWNDLASNFDDKEGGRPAAVLGDDGALHLVNRPVRKAWKSGTTQWLRHHSRLFGALEYVTAVARVRGRMQATADAAAGGQPPADAADDDAAPQDNDITLLDLFGLPTAGMDKAWRVERDLLALIRDRMEEHGGKLFVLFVAMKDARSDQAFRDAVVTPFENPGHPLGIDRERPARRLRAICEELGVPFLDLNPVFRAHADPDSLFLQHNGHWTAAGHALAAEAVAERLDECGLAVQRDAAAKLH